MRRGSNPHKDNDDTEYMVDLLMETSMSLTEIAKELGWTINALNKKINQLGLNWIKTRHKKMSRGQAALTDLMQKLLPNESIVSEHHIGDRLKLDIYCPKYKIAAEYHGRQHFYYTGRFFNSKEDFEEAVERDEKKATLCQEQGIALLVFRYNDKLTEEAVFSRILEAIKNYVPSEEKTNKYNNKISESKFYQDAKKRYNTIQRKRYKELKEKNGNRRKQ